MWKGKDMAVVSCMFGGMIGMLSALIAGLFFDVGFWGATALFFGVGIALAIGLILGAILLMPTPGMADAEGEDVAGRANAY